MFGAKLSWCQIVRCQIVLVPNCPGAKLSTFIILVPNCPLLLSWCQIVRFIILVPNCPVPNCPVPNCPVLNCPTIENWTSYSEMKCVLSIKESNFIEKWIKISTFPLRSGLRGLTPHNGRKSLILAPQEIPDISGYQWGIGCQCVKAYNNDIPVTNQKIL